MSQPPPDSPRPLVAPEGPPTLSPSIVEDDEALAEAVDQIIFMDVAARERLAEIGRYTEALRAFRAALDPCAWQLLLRIDELTTARWADLTVGIAKWAFEQGRRFPLSIEEGS
jgi:hypothetical protein